MSKDREMMQQALEKLEFFAHMKSVSEDTARLIAALRRALEQPAQQQEQEPVAIERWKWVFRDRYGEKYTTSGQLYTHSEAQESAKILGVEAVGPTGEPFICWELRPTNREQQDAHGITGD